MKTLLKKINETILPEQKEAMVNRRFIGDSEFVQGLKIQFARKQGLLLPVLVSGESGSGKGLIASLFHETSKIEAHPFLKVSPQTFDINKLRLFEVGTIYIPRIAELRKSDQSKLIDIFDQFAEEGRQVRFMISTQFPVHILLEEKKILEELFYRLSTLNIEIPPLRDRKSDIETLARHFIQKLNKNASWDVEAIQALTQFGWPGNVRELKNFVLEVSLHHNHVTSHIVETKLKKKTAYNQSFQQTLYTHIQKHFQAHNDDLPPSGLHKRVFQEVERVLIHLTLKATKGNQIKASQVLGINRNTLRKKISNLGL